MTSLQMENKLAHTYLGRIEKFSPEVKLDLVTEILLSMKVVKKKDKKPEISPEEYFAGIWESDKTAEEIIAEIKNTSPQTREIIDFD